MTYCMSDHTFHQSKGVLSASKSIFPCSRVRYRSRLDTGFGAAGWAAAVAVLAMGRQAMLAKNELSDVEEETLDGGGAAEVGIVSVYLE